MLSRVHALQGRNAVTREHKLALIVGFSVVLVVGVLISDHFSRARVAQFGGAAPAGTPVDFGAGDEFARAHRDRLALPEEDPAASVSDIPLADGSKPSERSPTEILMGVPHGRDEGWERIDLADAIGRAGERARQGLSGIVGEREIQPITQVSNAAAGNENEAPRRQTENRAAPSETPREIGPAVEVQRYEVKRGDSLSRIAANFYGDGNLWRKLAEYNGDRVGDDGSVRIGVTLLIPPREALGGGASAQARATEPARPRTYTVRRGDSLFSIANRTLGSGHRWREIYELNRSEIRDPDNVPTGLTLRIPPR